jgi:hypothetical protein
MAHHLFSSDPTILTRISAQNCMTKEVSRKNDLVKLKFTYSSGALDRQATISVTEQNNLTVEHP